MSVKAKGFEQLKRKLDRLEKKAARRVNRRAIRSATAVLLKAVKKATPKDEGVLRRMQTSKVFGKGLSLSGIVGADVTKLQEAESSGQRPSNIDWLVEEGHVAPDGTFVPPSGHMRRAQAEATPRALAVYRQKLAEGIEQELSK